ncbi:MAG: S46 family peptidase [Prevotellaceae bacterium]|jgi:hypothetical protein|nr:S46 family peptidase [Prevotellaceae bacterium]
MVKKYTLLLALCLPIASLADEGMWLINSFANVYMQMKEKGLVLNPEEIYNQDGPSLAGAVVAVDGGMGTGSMVSANGLMITNHHVAYGDIHALSTPDKNYLEDGFWALERKEEIPIKNKSVTFVRKVVDVTDEVMFLMDSIFPTGRMGPFGARRVYSLVEKRHAQAENTPYEPSCYSFFKGELYLLFYLDTYTDVRLVGAPPERLGAFGGETDNWGWPQHKCDFALYRVYGDLDGRPADYAPENVPLNPIKYLSVSTSGVQDGDFAMIIGFPGRTARYQSSFSVEQKYQIINPIAYKSRRDLLDVMLTRMEADPALRLLYADKYFSISNYTDYARWENICLRRYDVAGVRAQEEMKLQQWIDTSPEHKETKGNLLYRLAKGYAARAQAIRERTYFQEAWFRSGELYPAASRLNAVTMNMTRRNIPSVQWNDSILTFFVNNADRLYAKADWSTERDCFIKLAPQFVANVSDDLRGQQFKELIEQHNGDARALFTWAADNTVIRIREVLEHFFSTPRTVEEIQSDPMVALVSSVTALSFNNKIQEIDKTLGWDTDSLETLYARMIYKMRKDQGVAQYPDANSTMRFTYGTVGPLSALDAVHYDSRSTIRGYMEKYDPDNFEFRVDNKMQTLIKAADWGRWGEKGELYVNFLTDNDITGGNSGSPVLNGNGHLIGLAFDGNRESMAGDIHFHPQYFKTVSVDIRFVLWVMDKYAGAGKLIEELTLVRE